MVRAPHALHTNPLARQKVHWIKLTRFIKLAVLQFWFALEWLVCARALSPGTAPTAAQRARR